MPNSSRQMAERAQRDRRREKVADMDRFARHIEEFRYHVQDAMYREGAMRVTGQPHGFFFLP